MNNYPDFLIYIASIIREEVKPGFSNRLVSKEYPLKAKKSNKRQLKYSENECTPQGTRIYREEVTSRYKKYCPAVHVGFRRISKGLVTAFMTL
jgi:hypothetical protein